MYRHVRNNPLNTDPPICKGDIIRKNDPRIKPEIMKKFLDSGTWVEVSVPPLSELPDFEDKADVLAKADIFTITDLVEADVKQTAKKIKKSQSTIRRWQHNAMKWLEPVDKNKN